MTILILILIFWIFIFIFLTRKFTKILNLAGKLHLSQSKCALISLLKSYAVYVIILLNVVWKQVPYQSVCESRLN